MKAQTSVVHSTFTIERTYPASPSRVFSAFADIALKRRWFTEGEDVTVEEYTLDFRVGGREVKRFRAKGGFLCRNDTIYQDIVPDVRIVFAYTMAVGDIRISASLVTIELAPAGDVTRLTFTEQAAFFEGADGPAIREAGWRALLGKLGDAVGKPPR
jgi:uncharacterized protein YndB with AHSA1/START domain